MFPLISLPAGVWVDLYAATGILVGTSLILIPYSGLIDLNEEAVSPAFDTLVKRPLPSQISTKQVAGAPGSFARSRLANQRSIISVQLAP